MSYRLFDLPIRLDLALACISIWLLTACSQTGLGGLERVQAPSQQATQAALLPRPTVARRSYQAVNLNPQQAPTKANASLSQPISKIKNSLFTAINQTRALHGKTPLQPSLALDKAATDYAAQLSERKTLDHLDNQGRGPDHRIEEQGYQWRYVAENLAAGQTDVDLVINDWLESPPHRAALLSDRPLQIGLGIRDTGLPVSQDPYATYWVAVFATPR